MTNWIILPEEDDAFINATPATLQLRLIFERIYTDLEELDQEFFFDAVSEASKNPKQAKKLKICAEFLSEMLQEGLKERFRMELEMDNPWTPTDIELD